MRMPTHLPFGEGRTSGGAIDTCTRSIRRGSGNGHVGKGIRGYKGRPVVGEGGGLNERCLRRALNEFVEHYHAERNHQGKGNIVLFPRDTDVHRKGPVQCRERLGGLLRY